MEDLKTPKRHSKINWPLPLEYGTMAAFDNFSPKKYLRQMSILGTNEWKKSEQESHFFMSILKVAYLVVLFFLISYSLAPKIEICQEYF